MNRSDGRQRRWLGLRRDRAEALFAAPEWGGTSTPRSRPGPEGAEGLLVEEYGGLRLLRTLSDTSLGESDVAELIRAFSAGSATVTIMPGADAGRSADFWARLGTLLDGLRVEGVREVRLIMTAAGDDRPGAPALGRRIADSWGFDILAPDGLPLIVPGGGLFVASRHSTTPSRSSREPGNWWRFRPHSEPHPVGGRQPSVAWQKALEHLPDETANGYVIQRIPAGVLAHSVDDTPPELGDLCYAVPADPRGPLMILGVPGGEHIPADTVAELLRNLPEPVRREVRLAPGGRDILVTSQSVANALCMEFVVYTGMPLMAPATTGDDYGTLRSVLVGADGIPRWQALLGAVVCLPAQGDAPAPDPRPLRVGRPATHHTVVGRALAERGIARLSDRWRATVSRAGVCITEAAGERPPVATRPAESDGPTIEVGRPGDVLEKSLPSALGTLLDGLDIDTRRRASLLVHGLSPDGGRELRRKAAEYGLRSIRFQRGATAAYRTPGPEAESTIPATGVALAASPAVTSAGPKPAIVGAPAIDAECEAARVPATGDAPVMSSRRLTNHSRGSVSSAAPAPASSAPAPGHVGAASREPAEPSLAVAAEPPSSVHSTSVHLASTGILSVDDMLQGQPRSRPGEPIQSRYAPLASPPSFAEAAGQSAGGTPIPRATHPAGARQPADTPSTSESSSPTPASGPPSPDATFALQSELPAGRESSSGGDLLPGPEGHRQPDVRADATDQDPDVDRAIPEGGADDRRLSTQLLFPAPKLSPTPERSAGIALPLRAGHVTGLAYAAHSVSAGEAEEAKAPGSHLESESSLQRESAASLPEVSEPATGSAPSGAGPDPAPHRGPALPPVPFLPENVSSPEHRAAFRRLVEDQWERHAAAVTRALIRMPALRGPQQDDVRDDLIALHAYLNATDGPLAHKQLQRGLRAGEEGALAYAVCVASALRRLPSYRGIAFRGIDAADTSLVPGSLLRDPSPAGALLLRAGSPRPAGPQYAIWSATGRRVRELTGSRGGARTRDEVVFAPGSLLRVLEVRRQQGAPLVLVREMPFTHVEPGIGAGQQHMKLDDQDRTVLERLNEALRRHPLAPEPFLWPDLCFGALAPTASHLLTNPTSEGNA